MQCVTPMIRFYNKYAEDHKSADEKVPAKIVSRSEVYDRLSKDNNYYKHLHQRNEELIKKGSYYRYMFIPCGHCFACKLNYAADWANRIMFETQRHEDNFFITLTYNEEHLPIYEKMIYTDKDGNKTEYENDGTWNGSLEPDHVTKFIKDLRNKYRDCKIKYFYCGEYGEETKRPHYHMILFGAPLKAENAYDWHIDKNKKMHWKDKELEKLWNKGMIDVAEVEWSSAAYVARYCMKKIDNDNDSHRYAELGKKKEFVRMSRRPGIARAYFNDNWQHIYETDEIQINTFRHMNTIVKPPKAWDRLLKETDPELYKQIKESRMTCAERSRKLKEEITKGITDKELQIRSTENIITKGNSLKRVLE